MRRPFGVVMRSMLLVLTLTGCSGDFWGTGTDPNADKPHDNDTGNADSGGGGDTDTDTGGDTDTDSAGDTDTGGDTDPEQVDDDGDGVTEAEGDCDDTDGDVSPDESETPYNGADDDCDPATADDDLDNDGYDLADDCDDTDNGISPEQTEHPYNGDDDDCDPRTPDDDVDGDGYERVDDCDDKDADANPDAAEVTTDGVDNDCDGDTDEAFEVATVDVTGDMGNPSAIGVDTTGTVHLVYRDGDLGTLRYLADDGSGWSAATEIISDTEVGESLDLVVDGADQLQIAYTWRSGSYTDLWFGWMDAAGVWDTGYYVDGYSSSASASIGHYVSIDVDSDNLPSFAYYDATYLVPVLADYTSFGVAIYTDIDVWWYWTYATGYFTTLAIDSEDYDHVAWFDDNALGSEAQYSDFNESTVNETIAADGWYTSLALQSDDTACVAYQDSTRADLIYACRDAASQTWSPTTIDSTGSVGSYAQLAYDSADQPWIAYYDASNGDLKVATLEAGTWATWTVDSDGDVGVAPSIAVGPSDEVVVSYYDVTNGALKVATANE